MASELLNIKEAARRLGLRPQTIRRWIGLGKIGYVKAGIRAVRIPDAEIIRIVDQGSVPAVNAGTAAMVAQAKVFVMRASLSSKNPDLAHRLRDVAGELSALIEQAEKLDGVL